MLRRLRRLGLRKPPVGRALSAGTPFVVVCSATFFCARKNAAHFSSSGAKKRHIPPERYATVARVITEFELCTKCLVLDKLHYFNTINPYKIFANATMPATIKKYALSLLYYFLQ